MYKFHIVVPFYNAENYIEKNIESIQDQNYKNFIVSIINDCSSDESNKKILPLVQNDKRFQLINNKINCGALANIINVLSNDENQPSKTIDVLLEFGIIATRIQGLTGVWAGQEKIAAQGVRISRWVTMHGFALNVNPDLSYYDGIIPCGIFDHGITSMEELLGKKQDMKEVKSVVIEKFNKLFMKR